ncbi:hypothetical protein VTN00DRAFT_5666 [Thermoascus crustaceus]|uniref:uncharacterized protein n=1 Tax=Thermoascus crustaceus TaxID=5088 RepID=UPI0037431E1B
MLQHADGSTNANTFILIPLFCLSLSMYASVKPQKTSYRVILFCVLTPSSLFLFFYPALLITPFHLPV